VREDTNAGELALNDLSEEVSGARTRKDNKRVAVTDSGNSCCINNNSELLWSEVAVRNELLMLNSLFDATLYAYISD